MVFPAFPPETEVLFRQAFCLKQNGGAIAQFLWESRSAPTRAGRRAWGLLVGRGLESQRPKLTVQLLS